MTARYLAATGPPTTVMKRGSMTAPSGTPTATVTGIVPGYWNRGYVSDKHAALRSAAPYAFAAESPRCMPAVAEPLQRFYSGSKYAPPSTTYSGDRAIVASVSIPSQVTSAPASLSVASGAALGVASVTGCSVLTQAADHGGSATLQSAAFPSPLEPVRIVGPLQGSVSITSGVVKNDSSSHWNTNGSMNAPLSPKWNCPRHGSPPPMTLRRRGTSPPLVAVPLTSQQSQKNLGPDPRKQSRQHAGSPSPVPRHAFHVGPVPMHSSNSCAKSGSPLPMHGYRHVPPGMKLLPTAGTQVASGTLMPVQVHNSVRLENSPPPPDAFSGGSVSSSCRLDTMMLPGDVLASEAQGGGRLWDIGRAGGFMGHTFVVTSRPRRISWNARFAEEQNVEAIWPKGDNGEVSEIWAVRIIESMRQVGGLHEAETYVYVDKHGQLILIGESDVGELFFQDHEKLELWQSPQELRKSIRFDLMSEALDEMRAQIGESNWSVTTAARAVLTNANITKGTMEAEVAACWQQEPICTTVVIVLWQRYLCKLAQALSAAGNIVKPIDLIMRWMPLKADRGLPGELLQTMQNSGWCRVGIINNGQTNHIGPLVAHEMSQSPRVLQRQSSPSSATLARMAAPLQPIAAQRSKAATPILAPVKPGDLGRLQGIYENLKRNQAGPRSVEAI